MGTFNFWQWALTAVLVFAVVLPALLATCMVRFGPRHDAPRRARPRRVAETGAATPALSLLSGITGDGS
ncbi:hypothetical protein [Xanthomonas vesicatoria]|uniref:hypothetical protein n=1 Tax=Xanthomonas vesicatoria TaxID=56460 RepID=UPI0007322502|nr:hypothetical protein [Xanthomonas vesicatoria]KTF32845.1 hypothetical protein LMG919_17190 [Xanthomonas vesicatoria]MCC8558628.1 hypothetical protein [Xanthomonas vesicatoria]MCC8599649.1 hypothetical protein [Xanthomonas vesicatoria]MCC8609806.1 hypothetical protein [Xanthomonas vesicatoria]MCC8673006.1 hypothetical protein [Xanthomonas vesicatoria]